MNKKTVVVGMSGGVDSSVAAYLLKQQGYNVIGVTMQALPKEIEKHKQNTSAEEDAWEIAHQLNIPYFAIDFRKEFQKNVIDYFISEYQQGHTPNPRTICNRCVGSFTI